MSKRIIARKLAVTGLAVLMTLSLTGCGVGDPNDDIIITEEIEEKTVNLFSIRRKIIRIRRMMM